MTTENETVNQTEAPEIDPSPITPAIPETSATTSGVGKHVTEESTDKESEFVPKARFNEVNERAKMADLYERMLSPHLNRIRQNPRTGEYEIVFEDGKKREEVKVGLTDEHLKMLSEIHPDLHPALETYKKAIIEEVRNEFAERQSEEREYATQSNQWFEKAKSEFGEDINSKNSPLRQRAEKILYDELAERQEDGSYYIPPKAQYDAFAMAFIRLQKEAQSKTKAEKLPIKQQSKFVSDGGRGTRSQMSKEEFASLPEDEQRRIIREEFESRLKT